MGLVADEGLIAAARHPHTKENARNIAVLFREFVERSGYPLAQLSHIAVGVGPGTFIGTRTGIAFANGFAISSGIPMVAVGTLHGAAAGALAKGLLPVCIRSARRHSFYCGIYDSDAEASPKAVTLKIRFEGEVAKAGLTELAERATETAREDRRLHVLTDDRQALEAMAATEPTVGLSFELVSDFVDMRGMAMLVLDAIRRGDTADFADALYFRKPVP